MLDIENVNSVRPAVERMDMLGKTLKETGDIPEIQASRFQGTIRLGALQEIVSSAVRRSTKRREKSVRKNLASTTSAHYHGISLSAVVF